MKQAALHGESRASGAARRRALCALTGLPALISLLFVSACSTEKGVDPAGPGRRSSEAQTLGIFSPDLAEDMREQTLDALERDAFRREQRFLDAASPGRAFRSTRVPEAEIEGGLWSPRELYAIGAQLFNTTFTPEIGYGGKDLPALSRFHKGKRGGPDATRCATCHWRGGPAGAGDGADNAYIDGDGDSQSSALARNPIALSGAGIIEILAAEMTRELAAERDALAKAAAKSGASARGPLSAKGVSFGELEVRPDGSLNLTDVKGIGSELVVRPFGWKGAAATIRDAVEDELLIHHGMESTYLVTKALKDRVGAFPRPDPDGDGVVDEISEGQVSALTIFIAMQEIPQIVPPEDTDFVLLWSEGRARFASIGCASCHVPSMPLDSARFTLPSRVGGASIEIDLAKDGAAPRITKPEEGGGYVAQIFSDLKLHDVGDALSESRESQAVPRRLFLTRPLWGLARSRPYLHDARAATLEEAILLHGGEAQAARDAFDALTEMERAPLRVYLTSLTRARRMISP